MNASVLVLSSDGYSDLWQPFNTLFKKYWKDCPYNVYIMAEEKDSDYFPTLKTSGTWTARFRQALEQIDTKYVIILMEDFFLRKKVEQERIDSVFDMFDDNTATFSLELGNCFKTTKSALNGFKQKNNKQIYLCSCQPAIWEKSKLLELLQGELNPWQWETQIIDSPYKFYINDSDLIFDIGYYEDKKPWGVVQGKWSTQCIELFNKENIKINFEERGFIDMKLSIIIPYYKTLELTKKLLTELTKQTTKDVEIIVIDDGCNEKELDKFKVKVIHKKNNGVSSARNTGLDKAQGKYIAFVDSDDMVMPNFIATILQKIDKEPFDYCYMSWKNDKGIKYIINNEPPEFNKSVWNCVYKQEMIGTKRFKENMQYGEDWDFNTRVRQGKKANIIEIMYIYYAGRPDSETDKYGKGKLSINKPIKAQVVMFQKFISKIGGVETFIYEWLKEFSSQHDILFLYEESDPIQLQRYRKLVKCKLYRGENIECETYVNVNFSKNIADNVKASSGNYYDMCHTDYEAMGWKYTKHPKTTLTLCVSEVVQKAFKKQFPSSKSEVVRNVLNIEQPKRVLHLISATRLSWEKGYHRMKELAKGLNRRKIPFIWTVFTNDLPDENIDGFVFMRPRLNVTDYVGHSDYLMQLSNTEADGYSTKEAMALGIPVVSTNYPSIHEQGMKVGKHGYILEMDLSNIDEVIDNMYNNKLEFEPMKNDYEKSWKNKLGKKTTSDYIYDETQKELQKELQEDITNDIWIAVVRIKDEDNKIINPGEVAKLYSSQRVRTLLDHNMIKRMEE